jgi:3-dehydroquinate dehydratase
MTEEGRSQHVEAEQGLKRIFVVHGPNLNMLGIREPDLYGRTRLEEINAELANLETDGGSKCPHFSPTMKARS